MPDPPTVTLPAPEILPANVAVDDASLTTRLTRLLLRAILPVKETFAPVALTPMEELDVFTVTGWGKMPEAAVTATLPPESETGDDGESCVTLDTKAVPLLITRGPGMATALPDLFSESVLPANVKVSVPTLETDPRRTRPPLVLTAVIGPLHVTPPSRTV